MMTSGFFTLCLMITWVSDDPIAVGLQSATVKPVTNCIIDPCSTACFISNKQRNCENGQFQYCRDILNAAYYCSDAPTSYHITVPDATGYYSTWVESGPKDVQMENNKPIYVINGHGFYIWWTGDNTWRLNKEVGDSESISECDESNLVDCPWFDICVTGGGLTSGYYSPQAGEDGDYGEYKYYRSDGDYEFKIFYYDLWAKWRLRTYKSGEYITIARACKEDIIFDCNWVTDDLDMCAA